LSCGQQRTNSTLLYSPTVHFYNARNTGTLKCDVAMHQSSYSKKVLHSRLGQILKFGTLFQALCGALCVDYIVKIITPTKLDFTIKLSNLVTHGWMPDIK